MNQDMDNQSQRSNRFIFSDDFYNQLDSNLIGDKTSFSVPETLSQHEQEISEKTKDSLQDFSDSLEINADDNEVNSINSFSTDSRTDKPVLLNSNIPLIQEEVNSVLPESQFNQSEIVENSFDSVSVASQGNNDDFQKEKNSFNVESGINTTLEQEILKSKVENSIKIPVVENTKLYDKSSSEKNVYRARSNAIPVTPDWLQDEIQQEIMKEKEKGTSISIKNSTEDYHELEVQPEIINIDEQLAKQNGLEFAFSIADKIDYEKDLSNVPIVKSNLLNELREKEKTTGKISILARYGDDFCNKDYITNPAIGRTEEIKQLILILLTPEKSAILVGKPGIGKTSIVEGLAYQLQRNNVPDVLKGYVIVSVKTTSLLGTLPTGETRLQTLIDELKELDKVILFIDEIHMLMGATNESSLDFANMFKESLGRGSIKMIGATTNDEYERYVLRDKAFVRRFQRVDVEEPTREQTIQILMGTLPKIEKNSGVKLKYSKFVQSEIMAFIVDITTEYKRVYGIGSRYPDICLTLLAQAFSQAVFENRSEVTIYDIRNAIQNSKNIYPDVIRKELINFDNKFLKFEQEDV